MWKKTEKIMKPNIKKTYLKTWAIQGYYQYKIFEIDAGGETWLQADPITRGCVTRTAENENVLRIILENDAKSINKFQQKVR
ncbi:MAG: hypothetical protein J6S67_23195 [Methanobrevibacter sp.]|nr:hypothetical protein [Methanobrevibacter sp.]